MNVCTKFHSKPSRITKVSIHCLGTMNVHVQNVVAIQPIVFEIFHSIGENFDLLVALAWLKTLTLSPFKLFMVNMLAKCCSCTHYLIFLFNLYLTRLVPLRLKISFSRQSWSAADIDQH